jgi:dTMP kinase
MPFIVFEGIDGSGKSTHSKRLAAWLDKRKERALWTFEPTDGPVGKEIRKRLRDGHITPAIPYLFSGDRADHVAEVITPACEAGSWVICDRYYLSTIAYQSDVHDPVWLWNLNCKFPSPDLVIYMDVPVEAALKRLAERAGTADAYENEAYMDGLKARYESTIGVVSVLPDGGLDVARVDGTGTKDQVWKSVLRAVVQRFPHLDPGVSQK